MPLPPQLLNCCENPAPDRTALNVAIIEQLIGSLDSSQRRVLAVLVNRQLGGAEDVGVGSYHPSSVGHLSPAEEAALPPNSPVIAPAKKRKACHR